MALTALEGRIRLDVDKNIKQTTLETKRKGEEERERKILENILDSYFYYLG